MSLLNSRARIFLRRNLLGRLAAIALAGVALIFPAASRGENKLTAHTDRIAYNAGSPVHVKVELPSGDNSLPPSINILASITYAGETKSLVNDISVASNVSGSESAKEYRQLWEIPSDAATGRYLVSLRILDAQSGKEISSLPDAASFTVYRKLVKIERIQLGKTYYHPGDHVTAGVTIQNLSAKPFEDLRVEFSDRYWPWIGNPPPAKEHVVVLSQSLKLPAHGFADLGSVNAAVVPETKEPAFHQYGVVVWDHDRKNILDIAFSQLIFIRPPGSGLEPAYPGQYIWPSLSDVDTTSYRHFFPASLDSAAIHFDDSQTMFPTGSRAVVKYLLSNPTDAPWRGVNVLTRWISQDGKELARTKSVKPLDLIPGADPVPGSSFADLPAAAGLYRARVEVTNSFGQVLAMNDQEVAANPLPRSILIFCAHEDDEGGWKGLTRAAIENNIPIHFVYFTGGDAGSCDRFYEHSCDPEEALRFGSVRMSETRATLAHLGVPPEDIFYLGLPDGGSGQIWYDHPDAKEPYHSALLASAHSPYQEAAVPNLPYARRSVVDAVKNFIQKFQPSVIVTAHPTDQGHIDHIINNYFVVQALQEMQHENSLPEGLELRVDRIYDPKDIPYTPYHYKDQNFFVSGHVMMLAQESAWFYQSQGGDRAVGRIRPYEKLRHTQPYRVVLDWKDYAGWNAKRPSGRSEGR